MDAKIFHIIALVLTFLTFIFQIVAMATDDGMWSSDSDDALGAGAGCGMFECDGAMACGSVTNDPNVKPRDKAVTKPSEALCPDLAGHMSAAQAFAVVGIIFIIVALILCIFKLTPVADKIPCIEMLQCIHISCAVLSIVTFAIVAAAYDAEYCGCTVKDTWDSTLTYGFAFLVINTVLQIIAAILQGASQAMEGNAGGDAYSYHS